MSMKRRLTSRAVALALPFALAAVVLAQRDHPLTWPLLSIISPVELFTPMMSRVTSSAIFELLATLSVTSDIPSEAWDTFSAISRVVTACSSTAAAMVLTISLTSRITPVIPEMSSMVRRVEDCIPSIFCRISEVASAV